MMAAGYHDLHWSPHEKKVAHAAFEAAWARETAAIRREAGAMLARADAEVDVWQVHDFLSEKRRRFEQKYDYRYSVLIHVFARLLQEGWLTEADLAGLSDEKIELIRRRAAIQREFGR